MVYTLYSYPILDTHEKRLNDGQDLEGDIVVKLKEASIVFINSYQEENCTSPLWDVIVSKVRLKRLQNRSQTISEEIIDIVKYFLNNDFDQWTNYFTKIYIMKIYIRINRLTVLCEIKEQLVNTEYIIFSTFIGNN